MTYLLRVFKYNPYHDPKNGQFTSGPGADGGGKSGGGGGSGATDGRREQAAYEAGRKAREAGQVVKEKDIPEEHRAEGVWQFYSQGQRDAAPAVPLSGAGRAFVRRQAARYAKTRSTDELERDLERVEGTEGKDSLTFKVYSDELWRRLGGKPD